MTQDQIRERLDEIIRAAMLARENPRIDRLPFAERERQLGAIAGAFRNAILREFALRPVSQGRVDSESGAVSPPPYEG